MQRYENALVIALGSNLPGSHPSSLALLEAALDQFGSAGLTILLRSCWWRSAAWPDPSAPDYLNGLAIVEASLTPRQALQALHRIERLFGRTRGEANSARTLDLDLIAHGRTVLADEDLILPHPRAAERLFVMGPLAQIAPDWRHPVSGLTARVLAASASVGRDAAPLP
jgi:2-amino-4-hydroxy-6-hydroxymethyldihydropteridine diphosphokinase